MNSIKELISYITNQFKFWFIISEWDKGLHLRRGKTIRVLGEGLYFKIPFIDYVFSQPKRLQEITISQVNLTTKDDKSVTISCSVFFKIIDVEKYYNSYSEPNEIIDSLMKNESAKYFLSTNYKDFGINSFEIQILNSLKSLRNIGLEFTKSNLTTFSNAKTYRIIKDNLYSQQSNSLDSQLY